MSLRTEQQHNTEIDHIRDTLTDIVVVSRNTRAEMRQRFAQVNQRFDQVDQRLDQVDHRLDRLEQRFDQQDREFSQFRHEVQERFSGIETTLSLILSKIA